MNIALALALIADEHELATQKFGPFNSTHEGYAVIKEELDELWDAIKANEDVASLKKEAIQVGAMAARFLIDCCSR